MAGPSVLFVCLGNICRSPLAEAAFRDEAARAGLAIVADSAGTGEWHVGRPPDIRSQEVALASGVDISGYRARRISRADFRRFDWILALDQQILADVRAMMPAGATADVRLLMDMVPGREGEDVPDPYYGERPHFRELWREMQEAARALVTRLGATQSSG